MGGRVLYVVLAGLWDQRRLRTGDTSHNTSSLWAIVFEQPASSQGWLWRCTRILSQADTGCPW
eukprot:m.351293 g.351293  ORF g.351293 m.351293 type:complete len:63 (+) comp55907_c0_seq21:933-1121(+)